MANRDGNNDKTVHYQQSYQINSITGSMTTKSKNIGAQATTLGLMTALMLSGAGAVQAQSATDVSASAATAASITFTRDLTIGSSGADVIALQNWLISKGFTIAAGATGYFGGQTQAALARYQASAGIAPAAGYFGPLTRAKVNAGGVSTPTPTTPTNPGTSNGTLKGGEADLNSFDLRREQSSGNEGEEEVEIATVEFDVDDGDVRVERMEILVQGANASLNTQPWRYFDRIAIIADGKEIAESDADSRSDWSKSGTGYRMTFTGMKHVVREGDTAEFTIVADIADNVDSSDLAQTFTFKIVDRGIRAVDSEGIQHYVGEDSESVSFGFGAEENGDLRISANSDNPDASILVADEDRESGEYEVFVFDLENRDDVESLITDLTINVTSLNSGVLASDVIRRATLEIDGDEVGGDIGASSIEFEDMDIEIDGDDEVTATLVIRLARNATSTPIAFSLASANVEAEGVRSGNDASVSGTASSETHAIAFAGIQVRPVSTSQAVVTPGNNVSSSYGTYTIKFTVEGLEEDAYVASTTGTSGTVGVTYVIDGEAFAGTQSTSLTSTARVENGFYIVREGDTETFLLTVTLDPSATGIYGIHLDSVRFNDEANFDGSTVFTVASESAYRTNPVYITN